MSIEKEKALPCLMSYLVYKAEAKYKPNDFMANEKEILLYLRPELKALKL